MSICFTPQNIAIKTWQFLSSLAYLMCPNLFHESFVTPNSKYALTIN